MSQLTAQRKVNAAATTAKALRASARQVLQVFARDFWRPLDLFEVDAKNNEDSALREQIATICERYPFLQVFTLDAGFASRKLIEALGGPGKRTLFQVKGNLKETLHRL